MAPCLFHFSAAQVAKPGIAAVSKTAGRKAAQVQILPWALFRIEAPETLCRPGPGRGLHNSMLRRNDSPPGVRAVVDPVFVLDVAVNVSVILAAVFALYQLWALVRNRRSELLLRTLAFQCSREYEQAAVNAVTSGFDPDKCSDVEMKMIADFWDWMGLMGRRKLVNVRLLDDMLDFESTWQSMQPWVRKWEARTYRGRFSQFEWMAGDQRRRRILGEKRAEEA